MLETKDANDYKRTAKIVHRIAKHTALPDVVGPMISTHQAKLSEVLYSSIGFFDRENVVTRYYKFNNADDLNTIVIVIRYLLALGVSEEDICEIIVTTRTPRQNLTDLNDIRVRALACMDRYRLSESKDPASLKEDRIQAMKGLLVICCQAFIVYQVKPLYKRILSWEVRSAITHYEHNLINDPRLDDFCRQMISSEVLPSIQAEIFYRKCYNNLTDFHSENAITKGYITNDRLRSENRIAFQRILVNLFKASIDGVMSFRPDFALLRSEYFNYRERGEYNVYEDMSITNLLFKLLNVVGSRECDYMKRLCIIISLGEKTGFDLIDWYLGRIQYDTKTQEIEDNGWGL